jgi:hypothetical protein
MGYIPMRYLLVLDSLELLVLGLDFQEVLHHGFNSYEVLTWIRFP